MVAFWLARIYILYETTNNFLHQCIVCLQHVCCAQSFVEMHCCGYSSKFGQGDKLSFPFVRENFNGMTGTSFVLCQLILQVGSAEKFVCQSVSKLHFK